MAGMCSQDVGDTCSAELSLYYDLCNQVYISIYRTLVIYVYVSIFYTITLQDMKLPLRRNEKFVEI